MNESYNINNNISEGYSSDYNKFKTYITIIKILFIIVFKGRIFLKDEGQSKYLKKNISRSHSSQPFRYKDYNININYSEKGRR